MSPEFKNKIIEDLEKTGFPSEFSVRRTIYSRSGRWDSTGTMGYFDLDERKLRQIDVYAFMPCGDRVSRTKHTHTVWALVIEVKKSERGKPWVILFVMCCYGEMTWLRMAIFLPNGKRISAGEFMNTPFAKALTGSELEFTRVSSNRPSSPDRMGL
jgi:hypothetical protein